VQVCEEMPSETFRRQFVAFFAVLLSVTVTSID